MVTKGNQVLFRVPEGLKMRGFVHQLLFCGCEEKGTWHVGSKPMQLVSNVCLSSIFSFFMPEA